MLKPKTLLSNIVPQYIVDKAGKKTGVILDIITFDQIIEEIEDMHFGAIAHKALQKEDMYVEHSEVKKKIARKKS